MALCVQLSGRVIVLNDQSESIRPVKFTSLIVPAFTAGTIHLINLPDVYAGGAIRYTIIYGLDINPKDTSIWTKGRYEIYLEFGLYRGLHPDISTQSVFQYLMGINLAFESPRSLNRQWLIPYFGATLGGIYYDKSFAVIGSGLNFNPLFGVAILSLPNLSINFQTSLLISSSDPIRNAALQPQLSVMFGG